jgi:hypothetical protein
MRGNTVKQKTAICTTQMLVCTIAQFQIFNYDIIVVFKLFSDKIK